MKESKEVHMQGLVIDELTTCEDLDEYICGGYANACMYLSSSCIYNDLTL